ncbi:MAG: hypothetical protein IJH04_01645 [Eggerthellaceae bacterium]|nr:hypothetical protein [Eggerthellaceae bacterium]
MTVEDIELAANWGGDDGALVAALLDVRFLDGADGHYSVHDWSEHNPWAAGSTDRSESSKWAALCKRYGRDGAAERMPEYATRMRPAPEPHAPRTNPQCDPDAPLPSPSPSPIPKEGESAADAAPPTAKPASKVAFRVWLRSLPEGSMAIPEDHAVFAYAERVGIPAEFLKLAWDWFQRRYSQSEKKYSARGWPKIFQDSVEGNWAKAWWVDPGGEYKLTTVGLQLQRAMAPDAAA